LTCKSSQIVYKVHRGIRPLRLTLELHGRLASIHRDLSLPQTGRSQSIQTIDSTNIHYSHSCLPSSISLLFIVNSRAAIIIHNQYDLEITIHTLKEKSRNIRKHYLVQKERKSTYITRNFN